MLVYYLITCVCSCTGINSFYCCGQESLPVSHKQTASSVFEPRPTQKRLLINSALALNTMTTADPSGNSATLQRRPIAFARDSLDRYCHIALASGLRRICEPFLK